MTALANPPDQRVVLSNIGWETYERLLADLGDSAGPRLTYDHGTLEIMSPGPDHEEPNRTIAFLVHFVASDMGVRLRNVGSMTYKRPREQQGFEADSSFYIEPSENATPGRTIDIALDPPPNLVIEVYMSRSSIPKLDLYADLGVFEVWVWDDRQARFYILQEGAYQPADRSQHIPALTPELVTRFAVINRQVDNIEWYRSVQTWLRTI